MSTAAITLLQSTAGHPADMVHSLATPATTGHWQCYSASYYTSKVGRRWSCLRTTTGGDWDCGLDLDVPTSLPEMGLPKDDTDR